MKLAEWLKAKKLTDAEFGEMVDRDRATINRIKRGINKPSFPLIIVIERVTKNKVRFKDWV